MEWKELLLIDKPVGITSFDVIRRLRKVYSNTHDGEKAPKMGHAGTLDPAASGLMLIGVGEGTKKLTNYIKLDKEYVAEVLIGESRTTVDQEGMVIAEKEVTEAVEILRSKISTALTEMTGTLTLPVSAYSAIKKDGVPMYKRARAAARVGAEVTELPIRDMRIYQTELLNLSYHTINRMIKGKAEVRFRVGSGTYIRSLAVELGRKLGYPASLLSLRRTSVGEFLLTDAKSLPEYI